MNCREALQHLYDYLDGRLDNTTNEQIKNHLQICEHCLDKYEFEQILQGLVVEKGQVPVSTDSLRDKISKRIQELDEREEGSPDFFTAARPYLAAAAAVIVVFVGLLFYLSDSDSNLYAAFGECHHKCFKARLASTAVSTPYGIDSCVAAVAQLPVSFTSHQSDRKLVLGEIDDFEGRQFAHVAYEYNEKHLSVFIVHANDFDISGDAKLEKQPQKQFYHSTNGQLNYVAWQCEDAWCIAVGELPVDTLISFAAVY